MKASSAGLVLSPLLLVSPALAGNAPAPRRSTFTASSTSCAKARRSAPTLSTSARQGDGTTVKVNDPHRRQGRLHHCLPLRSHSEAGTWKGTQLVSFKSKTDDNGTDHRDCARRRAPASSRSTVDGTSTHRPEGHAGGEPVGRRGRQAEADLRSRQRQAHGRAACRTSATESRRGSTACRSSCEHVKADRRLPARPLVRRGRPREDDPARLGQFRDHLAAAPVDRVELASIPAAHPLPPVGRGTRCRGHAPFSRSSRGRNHASRPIVGRNAVRL